MPVITRGIRNANPGNIDYNPRNQWQGQLAHDPRIEPRFARFDTPENGVRALAKLILAYRGKDGMPNVGAAGIDTVREIINRWAPGHENDTGAYIRAVAARLDVSADTPLNVHCPQILTGLVVGIIHHENGYMPYAEHIITEGVQRAQQ